MAVMADYPLFPTSRHLPTGFDPPQQPPQTAPTAGSGINRRFAAMHLGEGYATEEHLTGEAERGGLQIVTYPMKRKRYERLMAQRRMDQMGFEVVACPSPNEDMGMGVAPGGRMRQDIYDDPYGLDDSDQPHATCCFVSIANSALPLRASAGEAELAAPPSPDIAPVEARES